MNLGAIAGWASVVLGQLVSWPQVLKLRRERGDGVSLAAYPRRTHHLPESCTG